MVVEEQRLMELVDGGEELDKQNGKSGGVDRRENELLTPHLFLAMGLWMEKGFPKELFVEVMLQSIHHCQKLIVCDILAFVVFYRMMLVKGERSSLVFGDWTMQEMM
ncbi:hypothetical protein YC2023_041277 [Brassica napus]